MMKTVISYEDTSNDCRVECVDKCRTAVGSLKNVQTKFSGYFQEFRSENSFVGLKLISGHLRSQKPTCIYTLPLIDRVAASETLDYQTRSVIMKLQYSLVCSIAF